MMSLSALFAPEDPRNKGDSYAPRIFSSYIVSRGGSD